MYCKSSCPHGGDKCNGQQMCEKAGVVFLIQTISSQQKNANPKVV